MKALIFNYENKNLLYDGEIPRSKTKNKKNFDSLESEILQLQNEKNILNLKENEKCKIKSLEIPYFKEFGHNLFMSNANYLKNENSFMPFEEKNTKKPNNIKIYTIDGIIETNLKLAFFFFEEGIVLKTNKTNYNLFGEEIDSYFSNITKTKFSTNSKKNALIFEDYKNLYDYLIKNKKIFIDMVKNYEYQFEIELVSIRDFLPKGDVLIVERLIEEINSNIGRKAKTEQEICEEIKQEKFFGPLPLQEKVSLEEMIVEAEKRLKYMNILDVYVSNFKREKNIYQSQMNGIIHNLDDCSKNISKKLLEDGYLPYHIVISKNNIGKTYNVLYVSRCPKNWNKERLNNKGYIVCYCFDNSTNFDNFETIQLTKTNGGLIRIN